MMKTINAKSILRKHKRIDSWFISSYAINLYRGCSHNCVYCDGRDAKYQVEGEFGEDIAVKVNAIELLARELNPERKRKPFKNGFIMICGGVSDSYQPFEKKYELCRQTLELLYKYKHPVHILTKSTLIERDIELLQKINQQSKLIISYSFSSADDEISKLLEPGVPIPSQRFNTIRRLKDAGIYCGMYLMPIIPFITDTYEMIDQTVKEAKAAGIDFIIFGGMTLKKGRQKDYFIKFIQQYFPEHLSKYDEIYSNENSWGSPAPEYMISIDRLFDNISTKYNLPKRIPSEIFKPLVSPSELVSLILDQLDYLVKFKGKKSPYGYAAYSLSKISKPIETLSYEELVRINGIGPVTAKIIIEIINTGKCGYYEKLL